MIHLRPENCERTTSWYESMICLNGATKYNKYSIFAHMAHHSNITTDCGTLWQHVCGFDYPQAHSWTVTVCSCFWGHKSEKRQLYHTEVNLMLINNWIICVSVDEISVWACFSEIGDTFWEVVSWNVPLERDRKLATVVHPNNRSVSCVCPCVKILITLTVCQHSKIWWESKCSHAKRKHRHRSIKWESRKYIHEHTLK